ncbi:MAG: lysophospholipase L1-like esterase, partial [Paenibacillus sp.]|nr:lysophospholipase L1-like esterase [Paenibacillus sp.]
QLLTWDGADVVLVYTYLQAMYKEMCERRMPDSVAELEMLAVHYGIGSIWVGLYAFEEVRLGRMDWDEWLPDGLHPTHRGSLSYAQAVIAFLEKELRTTEEAWNEQLASVDGIPSDRTVMPEPLNGAHWGIVSQLPFAKVDTEGPWTARRSSRIVWIDHMLTTSAIGAKLSFSFEGTGLALAFDFGKRSAGFRYRIDEGEPGVYLFDRQEWCPDEGMFHLALLARDLPPGQHRAELEVVHGDEPGCTGTRFKLAFIGVIHETR